LSAADLYVLAVSVTKLAAGSATRVVVNDRFDVALASGAHGVHLRGDSLGTPAVRASAPGGFLIGRSVHDAAAAKAAVGADYLIAGTVWPTASKPAAHPTIGLEGLSEIVQATSVPVLAIGGVTLERAHLLLKQGAAGLAAISLFAPSDELGSTMRTELTERVKSLRGIGARRALP